MVYKLKQSLYRLNQTLRAQYVLLYLYFIKIGFVRTRENSNIYLKNEVENMALISKVFVDDIIFCGNDFLCKSFIDQMSTMLYEIKISMGLQVPQTKNDIYVTQSKYVKEILKIFEMDKSRL